MFTNRHIFTLTYTERTLLAYKRRHIPISTNKDLSTYCYLSAYNKLYAERSVCIFINA